MRLSDAHLVRGAKEEDTIAAMGKEADEAI